MSAPAIAPSLAPAKSSVRVEDDSSVGRSYSKKGDVVAGLGAERRLLRSQSWAAAYGIGTSTPPTLESYTLAKTHLSRCSREDLLAYFRNTWDLTTTLFASLADDSMFYYVPDKLRRPLVFYSAHPAALYANKLHQAGLMGSWTRVRGLRASTEGLPAIDWDGMGRGGPPARPDAAVTTAAMHLSQRPRLCRHRPPFLPEAL